MFEGTGSTRRKYAGQTKDSSYAFSGDLDALEPGMVVVLTAAGTVSLAAGVPYGTVEHVDSDGMVAVCRYGRTRLVPVASGFTTVGAVSVVANADGALAAAGESAGRTALIDTIQDGVAAVTLL